MVNICREHKPDSITHNGKDCPWCKSLEELRIKNLLIKKLKDKATKLGEVILKKNVELRKKENF